jgi:hypothetical protein
MIKEWSTFSIADRRHGRADAQRQKALNLGLRLME